MGEYLVKSRLPTTQNHRKLCIPFVAALQKNKDVVLLMHDESNMPVNLAQPKAYVPKGVQHVDKRRKTGVGLGEGCVFLYSIFQFVFWDSNWNVGLFELDK